VQIHPSGRQFELLGGDARVVVVEVGGGIREWEGVLLGYAEDELCRSGRGQVLAPWPNRLAEGRYEFDGETHQLPISEASTGSAIHGLVRWAGWEAVERDRDRVVMEHLLHPQPGYPFSLRLRVDYRLGTRGLVVRTTAENVGATACPFGVGHHPYVAAPSGRVDDLILGGEPVGDRRLDDTVRRPGGWRIRVGDVTVWADGSWPYVQLFTGDLPEVGRRGLAVEPMTCPPQAFRTGEGTIRLEPGETFTGEWGIEPGQGQVPVSDTEV
jgi:aldose 1-epimerase